MPDVDVELERDREFVVHQAGGNEHTLRIAQIQITVANGILAQRDIVAVGNQRLLALADGERNEVVSLAGERGRGGARDSGNHPVQIVLGNGDFPGTGVTNTVGRLRNRGGSNDVRGGAGNRRGGLRHGVYCSSATLPSLEATGSDGVA